MTESTTGAPVPRTRYAVTLRANADTREEAGVLAAALMPVVRMLVENGTGSVGVNVDEWEDDEQQPVDEPPLPAGVGVLTLPEGTTLDLGLFDALNDAGVEIRTA